MELIKASEARKLVDSKLKNEIIAELNDKIGKLASNGNTKEIYDCAYNSTKGAVARKYLEEAGYTVEEYKRTDMYGEKSTSYILIKW